MVELREALEAEKNNVSAIKAVAAWLVIVGHAFAFACNYEQKDFLAVLTADAYNLGGFAVSVFFFFSGLFIAKSLLSGKYNFKTYAMRRAIRIFPPFLLVTVLIVLVCGFFVTDLDMGAYFANPDTWRYLLNCVFVRVHELPGVFTQNVYGPTVNGPIWTIKVEVLCYALCYVFYRLGLLEKKKAPCVSLLAIAGVIWLLRFENVLPGAVVLIRPAGMFFMGVLYTVCRDEVQIGAKSMALSVLGYGALVLLGFAETGIFLMLPQILCGLAFLKGNGGKLGNLLAKIGDASYETYLWGGFVGQTVVWHCGGAMSPWINMGVTIVAATALGMVTHRIFQKNKKG